MKTLWIAPLLLTLAGCASLASQNDPAVDLADAQVAVRTEANGDVIEEYRVAGQLRMVKVTPSRGPTYYLMDENGEIIVPIEYTSVEVTDDLTVNFSGGGDPVSIAY